MLTNAESSLVWLGQFLTHTAGSTGAVDGERKEGEGNGLNRQVVPFLAHHLEFMNSSKKQ